MTSGPRHGTPMIEVRDLAKTFVLHTQGGVRIPVFDDVDLDVAAGECVVLAGPSGSGKSTLMRTLYANYLPDTGTVRVRHRDEWIDVASAEPRRVLDVRRETVGYVSQFLRVIPRVPTLDVVAEPLRRLGRPVEAARERAAELLTRLRLPERLWHVPPATFSGGEQQRVNVAHGFSHPFPVLLLDEPTASLDPVNRDTVIELIGEARERGAAIVGIFHDAAVRERVETRAFDLTRFKQAA